MKNRKGTTDALARRRGVEADVLATAHGAARALHRVGAMDDASMLDLDLLCLSSPIDYSGAEVQRIRRATRLGQLEFAHVLGVDPSAVALWERDAEHPSGPVQRLLEVLDVQKPDNPILRLRQEIAGRLR